MLVSSWRLLACFLLHAATDYAAPAFFSSHAKEPLVSRCLAVCHGLQTVRQGGAQRAHVLAARSCLSQKTLAEAQGFPEARRQTSPAFRWPQQARAPGRCHGNLLGRKAGEGDEKVEEPQAPQDRHISEVTVLCPTILVFFSCKYL